uniref:Imidazole glycerol phosphate synthase hisHF n=1 Tax=Phaffia rhodozyma TaxID=264483 RepID=A0A1I9Q712_PHARH|nr:imidazoleglycerol phosphate synthase [Phaffia rhodozyma]
MSEKKPRLFLLDYGAGNVRSLANSIKKLGYEFEWIKDASDFEKADKLIFPGVGAFPQAINSLHSSNLFEPLRNYLHSGRPYFGICIGMQVLFAGSDEGDPIPGLGLIDARVERFKAVSETTGKSKSIPHMGWSEATPFKPRTSSTLVPPVKEEVEDLYFVHSYAVPFRSTPLISSWTNTTTQYGDEIFVSSIKRGNILACQFHPEKSGEAGLKVLDNWLKAPVEEISGNFDGQEQAREVSVKANDGFTKRVVACLDVRSNDQGDLVVTKGDQYDVREKTTDAGDVRNLGKPVELARRYYESGADEICFLNITSFRQSALHDQPMLAVVEAAAETVFVPLTVGGGIKDTVDPDGTERSALEVAGAYFRSGADKVSIGSDAVIAVEELLARQAAGTQPVLTGKTGIETISKAYGNQAVVVSFDPKRVYVDAAIDPATLGPHAASLVVGSEATGNVTEEERSKAWWYQCTINGGRAVRDIDVVQLAKGVEMLGAGEILLNSVDRDGSGRGFDLDLVRLVRNAVNIPVVASSGAGKVEDFEEVFEKTDVEAALAAGIFHRNEVPIENVKAHLLKKNISARRAKDVAGRDSTVQN